MFGIFCFIVVLCFLFRLSVRAWTDMLQGGNARKKEIKHTWDKAQKTIHEIYEDSELGLKYDIETGTLYDDHGRAMKYDKITKRYVLCKNPREFKKNKDP